MEGAVNWSGGRWAGAWRVLLEGPVRKQDKNQKQCRLATFINNLQGNSLSIDNFGGSNEQLIIHNSVTSSKEMTAVSSSRTSTTAALAATLLIIHDSA
eukprot:3941135-Rhodomonas_salina.5